MSDAAPPALAASARLRPIPAGSRRRRVDARAQPRRRPQDRASSISPPRRRPRPARCRSRIKAIGLNHIDVWGWRGMAFAKRKLPLIVGVEAAGEIVAVGPRRNGASSRRNVGDRVVAYGGLTCGTCKACREGRDNLCENVAGIMGFHVDGFARDLLNMPARLVVPVPAGVSFRDAACAPVAFGDRAAHAVRQRQARAGRDHPGAGRRLAASAPPRSRWRRRSAAPSSPPSATTRRRRRPRRSAPITSSTTATDRFEGVVRKLTGKKGVDVVFEHVGPDTFNGSLLCLKRGGRLVTCGSTSGQSTTINLFQLYLQQYRIFGSFGASIRNIRESLAKMASGLTPVIDTEVAARRLRARARAAREPAGLRQDHRQFLERDR